MKSALGWVILLVVLGGGAGLGLYSFHSTAREHAYQLELASLKRDFLTRTSSLYLLDPDRYRQEIGPHLNRYFVNLQKLAKEYPELYDIQRERKRGVERLDRGEMTESQKLARDERVDITLDLFERMMQGQYRPLYTQADQNFRFDIYDISPARVGGEYKVKFSYVHWGPFAEEHRPGVGAVSYKSIIGNIKAVQVEGKPARVPQIVGEAQPPSLQISPEKWAKEFPPGVEIGFYDLPQFPPEATAITLSFTFGIRTIGGSDLVADIAFPEIAVPDAWKTPEGQDWEDHERFASDEELEAAGAAPTQNE